MLAAAQTLLRMDMLAAIKRCLVLLRLSCAWICLQPLYVLVAAQTLLRMDMLAAT